LDHLIDEEPFHPYGKAEGNPSGCGKGIEAIYARLLSNPEFLSGVPGPSQSVNRPLYSITTVDRLLRMMQFPTPQAPNLRVKSSAVFDPNWNPTRIFGNLREATQDGPLRLADHLEGVVASEKS